MRRYLYIMIAAAIPFAANAMPGAVKQYVSAPELVGEGTLSVMFWDAYKAELYAPNGKYQQDAPLALKLTYLMDFDGADIADRSAKEMRKLGYKDEMKLAAWHREMEKMFPDVEEGQAITGVRTKDNKAVFYFGEKRLGVIESEGFAEAFFGIWLSEKTSEPSLREKLISAK